MVTPYITNQIIINKIWVWPIILIPLTIIILTITESSLANSSLVSNNHFDKKIERVAKSKRIVTLTSLTADIVSILNNSYLIGIPGSRLTQKNDKLLNKEVISKGRTPPKLEKIVSLKPDLVIGSKSFHGKQLKKLSSLGIRSEGVEVKNWSDLINLIDNLSYLTGTKSTILEKDLNNCSLINVKKKNNNNVLVLVSSKPLLAPNSESWAGSLLDRFNINNSTQALISKSEFKGYVNLSPEWLISNQPKTIIIVETGPNSGKSFTDLPYWRKLNAVKENNIIYMDYYGFINPGSIDSINKTCLKLSKINN